MLSSCIPGARSLDLDTWQTGLPCSVLGGGDPEPEMSHVVYTKLPPALNVDLMQATATETVFGMAVTAQKRRLVDRGGGLQQEGQGQGPGMSVVVYTKLPPALNVDLMQVTATETVFGMDVTAQNGGKCDPKFC